MTYEVRLAKINAVMECVNEILAALHSVVDDEVGTLVEFTAVPDHRVSMITTWMPPFTQKFEKIAGHSFEYRLEQGLLKRCLAVEHLRKRFAIHNADKSVPRTIPWKDGAIEAMIWRKVLNCTVIHLQPLAMGYFLDCKIHIGQSDTPR